ncbi:MAG TPA: DUF4397 domain-containing protein [Enhygromyxa sp.]|nr:DUF4397 domain-containing protein [Enhygromyxa sp.]
MTSIDSLVRPSFLTLGLLSLSSLACVLVGSDEESGGTESETGDSNDSNDTTETDDQTDDDTTDETDTDGEPICPGSEQHCTMAESHCGPDGTLEICQYVAEMDCIAHFSVDCEDAVGPGSMCETQDATMAGCTAAPAPTAMVRFLNLSDGYAVRFRVGGQEVPGVELQFGQSAHYVELPAGVDVNVETLGLEGNVVSSSVYPEFVAGHKYTVASMGLGHWPDTWVSPDQHVDAVDVPADHTRLTLVNATPDLDNGIYAQLVYDNEYFIDFYEAHGQTLLEYVQQVTVDAPLPNVEQSEFMALAAQWGVPAVYSQYWQGAALVQVANNESLYVFLTCTGECSSDEDRFLVGVLEDSSTFTVDLLQ